MHVSPKIRMLGLLLLFGIGYLYALPLNPAPIGEGIDSAWKLVMNYAFVHSLQFGKDIVFTSGPLMFVYTHVYYPGTFFLSCLIAAIIQTAVTVNLVFYINRIRPNFLWGLAVGIAYLSFITCLSDTYYMLSIALIMLVHASGMREKNKPLDALDAVSLALICLIKFSFLALTFSYLIILAFQKLYRRKIPYFALSTFFLVLGIWMAAHQNLSNFPSYLYSSYQISKFYVGAMSMRDNNYEPISFLIVGILLGVCLRKSRLVLWPEIFIFIFLYFMVKASFVRQDGHALIAGYATFAFFLLSLLFLKTKTKKVVFLSAFLLYASYNISHRSVSNYPIVLWGQEVAWGADNLAAVLHPIESLQSWEKEFERRQMIYRDKFKIDPHHDIDSVSLNQSNVVAYGTIYKPRPVFQSYTAYSPYLIQLNKDFYFDQPSPPDILYVSEPIDGRISSMDEPYLFSEMGNKVKVLKAESGYHVLRIDPEAKERQFELLSTTVLQNKEWLDLNFHDCKRPLWAKIEMDHDLSHLIEQFLYKGPEYFMNFEFSDHKTIEVRLVPGISESGFMISPLVGSATELGQNDFYSSAENCKNAPKRISFRVAYSLFDLPSVYRVSLYSIVPPK